MRAPAFRAALETASQAIALAVVVLAPLPFGSADRPWVALWCGLMGLSLALADLRGLARAERAWIVAGAAFLAAWASVAALQQTAPPFLGRPDPIWAETAGILAVPVATPRLGALAEQPWPYLGGPLLGVLVFVRMMLIGRRSHDRRRALTVMRWAILITGLASYIAYRADPSALLGAPKTFYLGSFTGTFVNANTAASYLGLGLILWAVQISDRLPRSQGRPAGTWSGWFLRVTDRVTVPRMAPLGALAASLGLVATTGSRAGLILSAGAAAVGAFLILRERRRTSLRLRRPVALVAAGALVLVFLVNADIAERLGREGLFDGYRLAVYRAGLGLVAEHPWLGVGAGAFPELFPSVRSEAVGWFGVWDRAHSTPLETAIEMGVPLALAAAAGWLAILGTLLRSALAPGRTGEAVAAAAAAGLLASFHSLIDFPLQTAGFLVTCVAVMGLGIARKGAFEVTGGR